MRLAILEHHEVIRRGLWEMAMRLDIVDSVSQARNLDEMTFDLRHAPVDVVIAGLEGTGLGKARPDLSGAKLLVLLASDDDARLAVAAKVAADGYVIMTALDEHTLRDALVAITSSGLALPAKFAEHLFALARGEASKTDHLPLSPREREVLGHLSRGLSNKQIALQLGVSIHAVKRHVSNVLTKMESPNRAHAVARAIRAGLLPSVGPGAPSEASAWFAS